ncbi:unnamed protein product [Fusarium venenatum]|uniref:Uncharacterized protein n=1 Tax=Fusarium venenatum TaxID=56646 RepID=A0A2L2SWA4_9HYPO|nr:uncharacterized protein FVRRES_06428 [Fusarium venenatum]CEI61992.1 unnamed protein product [Fusarium venenatum]
MYQIHARPFPNEGTPDYIVEPIVSLEIDIENALSESGSGISGKKTGVVSGIMSAAEENGA